MATESRSRGNSWQAQTQIQTSFSTATIDPKKALLEDVGLPGGDLGVHA